MKTLAKSCFSMKNDTTPPCEKRQKIPKNDVFDNVYIAQHTITTSWRVFDPFCDVIRHVKNVKKIAKFRKTQPNDLTISKLKKAGSPLFFASRTMSWRQEQLFGNPKIVIFWTAFPIFVNFLKFFKKKSSKKNPIFYKNFIKIFFTTRSRFHRSQLTIADSTG